MFLGLTVFAAQTLLAKKKKKREKKKKKTNENKSNRVPAASLLGSIKSRPKGRRLYKEAKFKRIKQNKTHTEIFLCDL